MQASATVKEKSSNKQKRKAYYRKCAASNKRRQVDRAENTDQKFDNTITQVPKHLKPGLTGYLITCNRQERTTQMESFRLLNDSLSRITPATRSEIDTKSLEETDQKSSIQEGNIEQLRDSEKEYENNCDIYSQLLSENSTFNRGDESNRSRQRYSFYAVRTGVTNCLFLAHYADHVTPAEVVHSVFDHLLTTQEPESRHVLRLLPVAATCHSDAVEIQRCIHHLLTDFCRLLSAEVTESQTAEENTVETGTASAVSTPEPHEVNSPLGARQVARPQTLNHDRQPTYVVLFKARNYDRLSRETAIDAAVSAVREVSPTWRISTASPDVVIALNVLRNVTCISLLEDFDTYRKYNVAELIPSVSATPEICEKEQQN